MISQRLRTCLALILLCLIFGLTELAVYELAQTPIAESLELASSGPLALHPHTLLDRLNEWRAHTPELGGMIRRLIGWNLFWWVLKLLGFSWGVLALCRPQRARVHGLNALGGMLVQFVALGLLRLPCYVGLALCAQGLMSADPFVPWALLAMLCLLSMLQVSGDLSLVRVMASAPGQVHSLSHSWAALGAWVSAPAMMIQAWCLRVAQIAVAAGPIYEQATKQPGPSSPRDVTGFVAASFLLWALRLWMLDRALERTAAKSQRDGG